MIVNLLKYFSIYSGSIYLSLNIINHKKSSPLQPLLISIFSFVMSLLTSFFKTDALSFSYIVSLSLLFVLITYLTRQPKISLIVTSLSFGICYCIYSISSFVVLLFIFPFYSNPQTFPHLLLVIPTIFLYFIHMLYFTRIKRFKSKIPYLFSAKIINFSTLICTLLITIISVLPSVGHTKWSKVLLIFATIFSLAFLIHWWQAQITKSYRHSVRERELESLRLEVQEKDKQLKELSKKNEQMGHLIHEDTKIIRTFISGLEDYVETDFSEESTRKAKGKELLEVVYEHADERLGTIRNISHKEYATYSTNIEALNLQLNHFSKRASIEDITFHVHIACNLEDYIPKSISTTDLSHLLSNLLDNAFIAASYTENPTIQLQLYEVSNCLVIEIADSGIPFEVESLVSIGLIQRTTHEDEGGSGIGLIEIWNLKEKYHATLHIEEYEQPCPYSKKLSLNFNYKNHFSIRTFRKKEIQYASKRIDLQIYE